MIHKYPLSWYVEKLEKNEPFSLLTYGDGEFLVAARKRTGREMQNGEVVTRGLEDEMRASLLESDWVPSGETKLQNWDGEKFEEVRNVTAASSAPILRGTEPFIIEPDTYGGRDIESVRASARAVAETMQGVAPEGLTYPTDWPKWDWVDGTVWDTAVREGKLGPLLRALWKRNVCLVSNARLRDAFLGFHRTWNGSVISWVSVVEANAAAHLDAIEPGVLGGSRDQKDCVYVVCMGIGAIPLIMRLRRHNPQGTYLDLGSTFDVFAGIGAERGWRAEIYSDPVKHAELIARNLEGVG